MSWWQNAKVEIAGDLTGFVKAAPVEDLCDTCNDTKWEPGKTLYLCPEHLKEATVTTNNALLGPRHLRCEHCGGGHNVVNCPVGPDDLSFTIASPLPGDSTLSGDDYKLDRGKTQWAFLADMAPALAEVARVLEYGANKYSKHGWIHHAQEKPEEVSWTRSTDAATRHIYGGDTPDGWKDGFLQGEDIDPESSCYHLAHAACDILFALTYQLKELGTDDRNSK